MYFKDKENTNIDDEFENENIVSKIVLMLKKYKLPILISLGIVIFIILMIILNTKEIINYLELEGEKDIVLYQGNDYIEPGFKAYNSENKDLKTEVLVSSNLDISKIGNYQITYSLGDLSITRNITIIKKPKEYAYIYLVPTNNSVDVYLKLGDKYIEPGYKVYSSTGKLLNNQVKVIGTVDTSKKGRYQITYSLIDSNNVTISSTRNIIVMDSEINLSLNTQEYTNQAVSINVTIIDEYFDYVIMPNNEKNKNPNSTYKVTQNGTYKFIVYNKKGISKETSITVNNIDKTPPAGSCTISENQSGSKITINASDNSGIKKYIYNNKSYTNNEINVSGYITNANIIIYDKTGNTKEISCKIDSKSETKPETKPETKVYISNIKKDGVIVTINAKKINKEITGYYFSYTNKIPNKNTGGYIKTNSETIDVVRLPGTTYVWVEDKDGKISEPKTIKVLNSDLFDTTSSSQYKILQGTSLKDYLANNGWSIEELNSLIARSARAAGLYSKEAAATSAVSLQTVLAQKYKIKLPYESAGIHRSPGAASKWGKYGKNYTTQKSGYYGMDCSAFVTWTYVNAGYDIGSSKLHPAYWAGWKRLDFKEENADIGDFLVIGKDQGNRHVKLIIGKTENAFITAEAKGVNYGMVITTHPYSQANGYKVQKAENITDLYDKYSKSAYPSGT